MEEGRKKGHGKEGRKGRTEIMKEVKVGMEVGKKGR